MCYCFNITKVGAAVILSKCQGVSGCDERHIHVQIRTQDHSVVVREGDSTFASSFGSAEASSADASDTQSVPENALPIENWDELQPFDLLIRCTPSDFRLYLNGKFIKTLSWPTWHDPSAGTYPSIQEVKWRGDEYVRVTKLAWTFGK